MNDRRVLAQRRTKSLNSRSRRRRLVRTAAPRPPSGAPRQVPDCRRRAALDKFEGRLSRVGREQFRQIPIEVTDRTLSDDERLRVWIYIHRQRKEWDTKEKEMVALPPCGSHWQGRRSRISSASRCRRAGQTDRSIRAVRTLQRAARSLRRDHLGARVDGS